MPFDPEQAKKNLRPRQRIESGETFKSHDPALLTPRIRPGHEAWERITGESAKEFAAFVMYRDMLTYQRSFGAVAKQFNSARQGSSTPYKNLWVQRVMLYDDYMDKVRLAKAKEEVEKMVERHLAISSTVQLKAFKRLREMPDDELQQKMSPAMILKYLVEGVEMERKTRGQPTSITKTDQPTAVPSDADLESEATAMAKDMLVRKLEELTKRKLSGTTAAGHLPTNRLPQLEIIAEADSQN